MKLTKESSRTAAAPCSSNAYDLLWRDAWGGSTVLSKAIKLCLECVGIG